MSDDIKDKPRSISPASAFKLGLDSANTANSLPPEQKAEIAERKLELAARTDWFVAGLVFLLILFGRAPLEPWIYLMVGIGSPSALASALHILGIKAKPSGSLVHLLAVGAGKVGLGGIIKSSLLGIVALFVVGCAALAPLAKTALEALAPVAADALKREAERRGVDIDRSEAVCVPLPEEYQPEEEAVIVVCSAPVVE